MNMTILHSINSGFMAEQQQKDNNFPPQPEIKEEAQKEAAAQRDLMGDAAVDPLPLVDEKKDPIAQQIKQKSSGSE